MIAASLLILAVLSYLGPSLVMLASVLGMALALWLSRDRSLPVQLVFLVIGSLSATIAAEMKRTEVFQRRDGVCHLVLRHVRRSNRPG